MDYLHAGLRRISWSVNRYSEAISVGDRVYIWQAAGKSKAQSGIVASCTVASEPWSGPDHEEALPYWVKPADVSSTALRVWLRPGKVANKQEVIKREWLISDPACSGLSILRQAAGTNYSVTTSEATRLEALWSKTGLTGAERSPLPPSAYTTSCMAGRFPNSPVPPWPTSRCCSVAQLVGLTTRSSISVLLIRGMIGPAF